MKLSAQFINIFFSIIEYSVSPKSELKLNIQYLNCKSLYHLLIVDFVINTQLLMWILYWVPRFWVIIWYTPPLNIRLFHWTTICWGDNYTGKNFVPPIKTRSPVVKAVKLMAWRQAKSPLKITTWSGGQRSASQISLQLTNWDIHNGFCLPPSHQFDWFRHWGSCIYGCWNKVFAKMVVSLTHGTS